MFDELQRMLETQAKDRFIAYADDLILVSGDSRREIEAKSQELVDQIVGWCKSAKPPSISPRTKFNVSADRS